MERKGILLFLWLVFVPYFAKSQIKVREIPVTPARIVCYAADHPNDFHLPPPQAYFDRLKSESGNGARFIIRYSSNTPPEARTAMQMAADIWSTFISSPVPIHVEVVFSDQMSQSALGGTIPGTLYKIYNHGYLEPLAYHVAAAEKITGRELNGRNEPDIEITFNSKTNWYYGTDGKPPPDRHDFVTVALHEITHGLGFYGLFTVNEDLEGDYIWKGNYTVFDHYLRDDAGNELANPDLFPAPSEILYAKLTRSPVYFDSPINVGLTGERAEMHIPSVWNGGSSLYHLAEKYNNTDNALMTWSIATGESIHSPGPITGNIFADISWVYTRIEHDSLMDQEDISEPFHVEAKFISDARFSNQSVHYSFDEFSTTEQKEMIPTGVLDEFGADIRVEEAGTMVWYYISVMDQYDRGYTYPSGAPGKSFSFYAGRDTIDPVVDHMPVEFVLLSDDSVVLEVSIFDNLGIDTAIVEYDINGVQQEPIGLYNDSANIYRGVFNFSQLGLVTGDSVRYRLTVRDKAREANTVTLPAKGYYKFAIEDIPEFREEYSNDFEWCVKDFLLNGFQRHKPLGWSNYALHTDHPYKAPKKDNTNYNFVAQLRVPIRLRAGEAFISFREIALIEPGEDSPEGRTYGQKLFYDYVVVEGSKDQGKTWHPFGDGYDCRKHPLWNETFNSVINDRSLISLALPDEDHYKPHLINMLDNDHFKDKDTVLIRFRLFSDPYFNGWGWVIDDLQIQGPLTGIREYALVPDAISLYPNPSGGTVNLMLEMTNEVDGLTVSVYDMVGKQMTREIFDFPGRSFNRRFDLNHLENGLYFFVIESGRQRISRKVVLAR